MFVFVFCATWKKMNPKGKSLLKRLPEGRPHLASSGARQIHHDQFGNFCFPQSFGIAEGFMTYPSLPADAIRLCQELNAPPLLVRHLILVHSAAVELLDGLAEAFPGLPINRDEILFGAATHDLGKVKNPNELSGPGNRHEADGFKLLQQHGVPPRKARFAGTHGRWQEIDDLEDLLVSLADSLWCGRRIEGLETKVATLLATASGREQWECWATLDAICEKIASDADQRLAWQAQG
jgi:hypothetical protein